MINSATLIYFSPTYSTQKIIKHLASSISKTIIDLDITNKDILLHDFDTDLVIFGMPVYGGRIPKKAIDIIEKLEGNNLPAVSFVVYGNRDYDDALLELNDTLNKINFKIIGSASFIAEHCLITDIAKGRPNEKDFKSIEEFGKQLIKKYYENNFNDIMVKGQRPYKIYNSAPVSTVTDENCISCKLCALKCPANAISINEPSEKSNNKCILCSRCIKICKQKARNFETGFIENLEIYLKTICETEKQTEMFL